MKSLPNILSNPLTAYMRVEMIQLEISFVFFKSIQTTCIGATVQENTLSISKGLKGKKPNMRNMYLICALNESKVGGHYRVSR